MGGYTCNGATLKRGCERARFGGCTFCEAVEEKARSMVMSVVLDQARAWGKVYDTMVQCGLNEFECEPMNAVDKCCEFIRACSLARSMHDQQFIKDFEHRSWREKVKRATAIREDE